MSVPSPRGCALTDRGVLGKGMPVWVWVGVGAWIWLDSQSRQASWKGRAVGDAGGPEQSMASAAEEQR